MNIKRGQWPLTANKTGDDRRVPCGDNETRVGDFRHPSPVTRRALAFTLLEVMFAVVAFCTATFAILALVSQSIQTARRLQRPMVDAGLVAAELSLTNKLAEVTESGDLGDLLGDDYKNYTYDYAVDEAETNKLFQVVIAVQNGSSANSPVVSKMTVLFYRPDSPAGSLDGGNFTRP